MNSNLVEKEKSFNNNTRSETKKKNTVETLILRFMIQTQII
jgi:hypothetical protein